MSKSPFYKTGISKSPLFVAEKKPSNKPIPELKPTLEKHEPIKLNSTGDEGMMSAKFYDGNRTEGNDPSAVKNRMNPRNQRKTTGKPLKMNEGDISKKRRARRAGQIKKMEDKLNSMSIDENTIKPGMEKAHDKLSAKIDAHAEKTTKLLRS